MEGLRVISALCTKLETNSNGALIGDMADVVLSQVR